MRAPRSLLLMTAFLTSVGLSAAACDDSDDGESVNGVRAGDACETFGAEEPCKDGSLMLCGKDNGGLVWTECVDPEYLCVPGDELSCGFSEPEFANWTQTCEIGNDGQPQWEEDACNTPLVLSFDGGPVEMLASSVAFDISGVGLCLDTDWPAATNPWLAIDLDHNGYIDGGHELFGSGTITAAGHHAKNGFVALAELDQNGDGKVDPADPRFDEILVWRDEDSDKQSLPWELRTLAEEGVASIELDHHVELECDERGNCGRERSRFEFVASSGERRIGEVVDIYPACR